MKKRFLAFSKILKHTFKDWWDDDPLRESAVIAFFAIFSVPALLVLIVNFTSLFFEKKAVHEELSRQIKSSINPATAEQIQQAVDRAGDMKEGVVSTIIGIVIIVFGATRVFIHLQKTINHIWDVRRKKAPFRTQIIDNLFSIGLIISIGFLLLVSMALSAFLAAANHKLQAYFPDEIVYLFYILEFAISLLVITILFALMFKFLPDVKVKWRHVTKGALLTALLFMILKYLLGIYFAKVNPGSVYGTAGTVVLVMLWVAVSSMIVFFGAEFTKQYANHHGAKVEAKPGAKIVKEKTVDNEEEVLTTE